MQAEIVSKAERFARKAHEGQKRKGDGDIPYITHPERVAQRLLLAGVEDAAVLAAAWLHDTVEDTGATPQDIQKEFGNEVSTLVAWMTQDKAHGQTKRHYLEAFRNADPRACLIKVADRLDNLRDGGLDAGYTYVYAADGLFILACVHQNTKLKRLAKSERKALRVLSQQLSDTCGSILWEVKS